MQKQLLSCYATFSAFLPFHFHNAPFVKDSIFHLHSFLFFRYHSLNLFPYEFHPPNDTSNHNRNNLKLQTLSSFSVYIKYHLLVFPRFSVCSFSTLASFGPITPFPLRQAAQLQIAKDRKQMLETE